MTEKRWVTVFEGPAAKAAVLRGLLESDGLECFVPDELTKMVDPFITGANPFQVRLQVPEEDVARAQALLESEAPRPQAGPDDGEEGSAPESAIDTEDDVEADAEEEDVPPSPAESAERDLDADALRTIWLAELIVTAPLALISHAFYLRACRRAGARSRLHAGATLAFVVALAACGAVAVHLAVPPREPPPEENWPFETPPPPPPSGPPRTSTPIGPR